MTARPRARIVCTLGPASATPEALRALVDAGMDVARLNFSHGNHDEHGALIERVRAAAKAAGRTVAVLADLQGPKIRLGEFAQGRATLESGAEFTISTEQVIGDAHGVSTTYEGLAHDVHPGDPVLLADGLVRLEAVRVAGARVVCRVAEGGVVSDHAGINLPGVKLATPALTAKDRADLAFALERGADLVTLSFVRAPEDATLVRGEMARAGRSVPVIAKLEKQEAVERLEDILDAFDGIMVARGDLGVETPLERVPWVQKHAIRLARARAKPVIVATEMLESMISRARPTRAEASDVANATLDGADALMLSGETSVGKFTVETVATMRRLILAAEEEGGAAPEVAAARATNVSPAVARAAVDTARALHARVLAAFTRTGATARQIASHRPAVPTLAFASDDAVVRQLALVWGVESVRVPDAASTEEMIVQVDRAVRASGAAVVGDLVVIVAGAPIGVPGSTNLLHVHRVGDDVGPLPKPTRG